MAVTLAQLGGDDIILTGTPNGAGARFDPPKWLVPGDVVEVEVSGIGVLSNPVAEKKVDPAPARGSRARVAGWLRQGQNQIGPTTMQPRVRQSYGREW